MVFLDSAVEFRAKVPAPDVFESGAGLAAIEDRAIG
jgi:hypothetical protein